MSYEPPGTRSGARHRLALALAGAALVLVVAPAAAQTRFSDPWDPAAMAAAEAAVARLGDRRALDLVATVLRIEGLEQGVAGAGTGIVASVQQVRESMAQLGAQETDLEIRVELPADVLFDFDRAEVRSDAAEALAHLAVLVRAHEGATVRLEGHTDGVGSESYNQRLSARRAESVRVWLVEREGLAATRFTTHGFGETRPVATNETDEGRQRNRRVEVVIEKLPPPR